MNILTDAALVYVIDDDDVSRESLLALITTMGLEARAYPSAVDFWRDFEPDRHGCVVTDLRMPDVSGLDLQLQLADLETPPPVIVVSGFATVSDTVRAMRTGAITVLEKPLQRRELRQAISEALEFDTQRREHAAWKREMSGRLATLTESERRVMELLLAGKPNKAVASELDSGIRTIERQRHNLLRKMGVDTLAELARVVALLERDDETMPLK